LPKGVACTHRNLIRLVEAMAPIRIEPGTSVAQVCALTFDPVNQEIWLPLLRGGRVCFIDKETYLDGPAFAARLQALAIEFVATTTAVFHQFAADHPEVFRG